jgi:alpha-L-rhamnosidase
MALTISRVSFEHHRTALGITETKPRISWRFEGDVPDWEQSSYEIEVTRVANKKSNSFSFNSSQSLYVPWPDTPLDEAEAVSVRIRAHGLSDQNQPSTPWSDWVSAETGLFSNSWENARPIASTIKINASEPKRPVYFRKGFEVPDDVESARLYITALGIYEAEINGKRVGDHVLAPGWQSYHHRHVYDTYDVTDLLKPGHNAIGALVGEGWYAGRLGFGGGVRNIYGNSTGLLAQLRVKLSNGTSIRVHTDTTWKSSFGPVVAGEIYDGEKYDATLESDMEGWSASNFDSSSWHDTRLLPAVEGKLVPPDQPPVRRIEEVKPQKFFKSPKGKQLVDFGQNLVGWLRLKVDGPSNTTITLHHAEVLENGELAIRPLRKAKAEDTIKLSGNGPLEWEPKFTFHGFRYAQIDGWPEDTPLDEQSVIAIVVHTDMEETGYFNCSHELLNKFHSNVRWSMKGNFLTIPTDCPQRDERLGWTGDAHAFGPTSNYLYDTASFWKSWHKDVWSEMSVNNSMIPPFFVPTLPTAFGEQAMPAAVWGDVVVASPWNLYEAFGDKGLLEEHLPQAQGWIDTGIPRSEDGLWNRSSFQFGDWLDPLSPSDDPGGATTHKVLVADAYLIKMTETLAQIVEALGKADVAEKYKLQHADLKREFQSAWAPGGKLANKTQTAYALSLGFDLLEEDQRDEAAATLREIVKDNDYLVGTGFAGTSPLGFALKGVNATDDFYRMLLQEKVPSWLYQVVMGGTTTWERWDSLLPNGTVNPGEMTSFNHYSFGSVANWMHQVIGGIAPLEPGYKKIAIAPIPGGNITHGSAKLVSGYGTIATDWTVTDAGFHLRVRIPPNTKAEITMPSTGKSEIVGSGYHEFLHPAPI